MLGSSKRTQDARVALDYRFEQLLRLYRALITSTTPYTHTNHEPILNWSTQKTFEICKSLQKITKHITYDSLGIKLEKSLVLKFMAQFTIFQQQISASVSLAQCYIVDLIPCNI